MKAYYVRCAIGENDIAFIILSSWWKLIWWLLRKSRRCSFLDVFYYDPTIHGLGEMEGPHDDCLSEEDEDPCANCLRWDECNGVDHDNCPNF